MGKIRQFDTGATRDSDEGKNEYGGFLSPLVIEEFGNYMHKHRKQADGKLRDSDNWQKEWNKKFILNPIGDILDLWFILKGYKRFDKKDNHEITLTEACCAILFNVQGILHEELKKEYKNERDFIEKGV